MIVYIHHLAVQSNLSYPDSCYPGTSLNRAADLPYFVLILQKLWAVQWVWPIIAYIFILYSEIRTNLSYGHPLIRPLNSHSFGVRLKLLGQISHSHSRPPKSHSF